jgi:hypothetical protein
MAGVEAGLFCAGIFEWSADGALPGSLGNIVVGVRGRE